jgi:hypothetical protein
MKKSIFIFLAMLSAALSLLTIFESTFNYQLSASYIFFIEKYDQLASTLVSIIVPFVNYFIRLANRLFGWQLELHGYWKHVLIAISLYMTNFVTNNLAERPRNARVLGMLSPVLAIVGSVGFGTMLSKGITIGLLFPVISLVLFSIAACLSLSILYPPKGQNFWPTFKYHTKRTVQPFIVIGGLILFTAIVIETNLSPGAAESSAVVLLASFVLALGLNLLIRGPTGERPAGRLARWRHWFNGSFGPRLGMRILGTYLMFAFLLLVDSGLFRLLG